jgi:hypothetical protein
MKVEKFTKHNKWKDFDFSEVESLQDKIIKEFQKKHEIWIEYTIRKFAYPKIRGEITDKKLKRRGIKLKQWNGFVNITYWITQNEKQIGESFTTNFMKAYT